ncbi:MAG TPA: YiaA/YiaB family inner membrane protein [Acidimicrobiales bacterium]|nr:YiaA/YiaB family inner membrane protein [Acidimicrobiales bacterium]
MSNIMINQKPTSAFYAQATISFGVSVVGVLAGIAYLPVSGWMRAFLALGLLYAVTSAFTLAKCVRDNHEANSVVHRVDEARLEKFLTEYDPLRATS